MKNLSHREAERRRNERWNEIVEDAILRGNRTLHAEKVKRRVIRLLTWSAIATALFTAYAVVVT